MQHIISHEQRAQLADMMRIERLIVQAKRRSSSPPRLRLFCFPYAGGGATIYRSWSDYMPGDIEVCPVYLPGRESRFNEPAFTRLEPLVRVLAHVLQPLMDVPFAFFGHSMGALISFELARYLRQIHVPEPTHLLVSAHRAPQLSDLRNPIHQLSDDALFDRLFQLGGTPKELLQHTALMQLMLPMIRADFALCETYTYTTQSAFTYPITAFGGIQDHLVSKQELQAWKEQTQAPFSLHLLPGDHFFLREQLPTLVHYISEALS